MAQLTQQQVVAYNKKVEAAKQKASQDKARKELAEKELARTCSELSELLGKEITPENLESEYAAFQSEALKTIESGTRILEGLEREASAVEDTGDSDSDSESDPAPVARVEKVQDSKSKAADLDLDSLLDL